MVVCGICDLNGVDVGSTLIHVNKAHRQGSPLCAGCAEPWHTIINVNLGCKTCVNKVVKWPGNIENLEAGKKVSPSGSETEKGLLADNKSIFQAKNKSQPVSKKWEDEDILSKSFPQAGGWEPEAEVVELGECSMGPPTENNPGYAPDLMKDWGRDDGYQCMQDGKARGDYQQMSNLNYPEPVGGRPRLVSSEHRREQARVHCAHCSKSYADVKNLRYHEKAAHQNFCLVCPLCGHSFKYQSSFSRHKKCKHPQDCGVVGVSMPWERVEFQLQSCNSPLDLVNMS